MEPIRYDSGLLIQASDLPALGDDLNGGIPEGYRTAARIIKPIRFEGYRYSVIKPPFRIEGPEVTLQWIRRFD